MIPRTSLSMGALVCSIFVSVVMGGEMQEDSKATQLRGTRRLPGDYDLDFSDMDTAEAGFAIGFLLAILLLCCLLCMCCGGGTRCSLWDCLALVCIWEMCCDGRNPSDFVLI